MYVCESGGIYLEGREKRSILPITLRTFLHVHLSLLGHTSVMITIRSGSEAHK